MADPDGRRTFSLGPVELFIVCVGGLAVTSMSALIYRSVTNQLTEQHVVSAGQGETLQAIALQQAVMNGRITTLSDQLSNIPSMTRELTEISVRQADHDRRITELEAQRGKK